MTANISPTKENLASPTPYNFAYSCLDELDESDNKYVTVAERRLPPLSDFNQAHDSCS